MCNFFLTTKNTKVSQGSQRVLCDLRAVFVTFVVKKVAHGMDISIFQAMLMKDTAIQQ